MVSNVVNDPTTNLPLLTVAHMLEHLPELSLSGPYKVVFISKYKLLVWKIQFIPLVNCLSLHSFIDLTISPQTPSPTYLVFKVLWHKDQFTLSEKIVPSILGLNMSLQSRARWHLPTGDH